MRHVAAVIRSTLGTCQHARAPVAAGSLLPNRSGGAPRAEALGGAAGVSGEARGCNDRRWRQRRTGAGRSVRRHRAGDRNRYRLGERRDHPGGRRSAGDRACGMRSATSARISPPPLPTSSLALPSPPEPLFPVSGLLLSSMAAAAAMSLRSLSVIGNALWRLMLKRCWTCR